MHHCDNPTPSHRARAIQLVRTPQTNRRQKSLFLLSIIYCAT